MADHWHVSWIKEGVQKWNQRRKKVEFSPDLSGIRFFDLLPPDFRDHPKTSRYFEGIDLSSANLRDADLSDLNFSGGNFSDADLSNSDLSMSNFERAKFIDTNLAEANLSRSYFADTYFERTDFSGVNLEDVEFENSIIIEPSLSEFQQAKLRRGDAQYFETKAEYQEYRSSIRYSVGGYGAGGPASAPEDGDSRTQKNRYDVFFGTNREPLYELGAIVGFGNQRMDSLSYGVCEVIVPESHRIGSLGSPLWKRLLNRKDDRLSVEKLISLNSDLFWQLLQDTSIKMKIKERPTVFVHGYNNSFDEAVLRSAQIGFDLGLGQGIGLFSWPSKGEFLGYSADEAASEASKYILATFLEDFVENSTQKSINIIAHSMGCRCVLGAMEVLSNGKTSVLKSINQVILAAADVDTAIMPQLGQRTLTHCTRATSYVSDKDKALKVSGWLHQFPRVGVSPPTFVLSGMDTVMVNKLDLGGFSHGYLGKSRTILNDVFDLLRSNSAPDDRHAIEAVTEAGSRFWRIKE